MSNWWDLPTATPSLPAPQPWTPSPAYDYEAQKQKYASALPAPPSVPVEPPPPPTSWLGEIGTGFSRGAQETKNMFGQALQYGGQYGLPGAETGKQWAQEAQSALAQPEMQLHPDQHNVITNTLASGAEVALPVLPALAGGVAAGMAAPALGLGAVGTGAAVGAANLLGALPFGASAAQQTLDEARAANIPEDQAQRAALINAGINTAGPALLGSVAGKMVSPFSRAVGGSAAEAIAPGIVKPFLRELPADVAKTTGIMAGLSAGTAGVKQAYDIPTESPMQAAIGSIQPSIGMSALLAPLGLVGRTRYAQQAKARATLLSDASTPPEIRQAAANEVYTDLQGRHPEAAQQFQENANAAIQAGMPLTLDESVFKPLTPEAVTANHLNEPLTTPRGQTAYTTMANRVHELSDEQLQGLAASSLPDNAPDTLKTAQTQYQNELTTRTAMADMAQHFAQNPAAVKGIAQTLSDLATGKPIYPQSKTTSAAYTLSLLPDDMVTRYRQAANTLISDYGDQLGKGKADVEKARAFLDQEAQQRENGQRLDPEVIKANDLSEQIAASPIGKMNDLTQGLSSTMLDRIANLLEPRTAMEPGLQPRVQALRNQATSIRSSDYQAWAQAFRLGKDDRFINDPALSRQIMDDQGTSQVQDAMGNWHSEPDLSKRLDEIKKRIAETEGRLSARYDGMLPDIRQKVADKEAKLREWDARHAQEAQQAEDLQKQQEARQIQQDALQRALADSMRGKDALRLQAARQSGEEQRRQDQQARSQQLNDAINALSPEDQAQFAQENLARAKAKQPTLTLEEFSQNRNKPQDTAIPNWWDEFLPQETSNGQSEATPAGNRSQEVRPTENVEPSAQGQVSDAQETLPKPSVELQAGSTGTGESGTKGGAESPLETNQASNVSNGQTGPRESIAPSLPEKPYEEGRKTEAASLLNTPDTQEATNGANPVENTGKAPDILADKKSIGSGSSPASIDAARASIRQAIGPDADRLEQQGRIVYHETDPTGEGAAGFVDQKGVAHFIPSNMDTSAASIAAHEGVHIGVDTGRFDRQTAATVRLAHRALSAMGLRRFIGDPSFIDLQRQAQRLADEGQRDAVKAREQVDRLVRAGKMDPAKADEEQVAYLAQHAPAQLPFVKRILSAIRSTLYRMGVKVALKPEDVRGMALDALRFSTNINSLKEANFSHPQYKYNSKNWDVWKNDPRFESDDNSTVFFNHGHNGYIDQVLEGKNKLFDGLFALKSPGNTSFGNDVTAFRIADDKILDSNIMNYDIDHKKVSDAINDILPTKINNRSKKFDEIWKAIVDDKSDFESLGLKDDGRITKGSFMDIMGFSKDEAGEASWFAQNLRGKLAKKLGYNAVEMSDENGKSWYIVPGTKSIPLEDNAAENVNNFRYSRRSTLPTSEKPPEETKDQAFRRAMQDKANRYQVVQDWLKKSGINVSPPADVYGADALLPKKLLTGWNGHGKRS